MEDQVRGVNLKAICCVNVTKGLFSFQRENLAELLMRLIPLVISLLFQTNGS